MGVSISLRVRLTTYRPCSVPKKRPLLSVCTDNSFSEPAIEHRIRHSNVTEGPVCPEEASNCERHPLSKRRRQSYKELEHGIHPLVKRDCGTRSLTPSEPCRRPFEALHPSPSCGADASMLQPKKYSFVTSTDDLGGFKDASVQRLVRQHAMWETSRARKLKPGWSTKFQFQTSTTTADSVEQREIQDLISSDDAFAAPKAALKRARGRKCVIDSNSSEDRAHRTVEHTPRITTPAFVGSPQNISAFSRLGSARFDPFETYPVVLDSFEERVIHDSKLGFRTLP